MRKHALPPPNHSKQNRLFEPPTDVPGPAHSKLLRLGYRDPIAAAAGKIWSYGDAPAVFIELGNKLFRKHWESKIPHDFQAEPDIDGAMIDGLKRIYGHYCLAPKIGLPLDSMSAAQKKVKALCVRFPDVGRDIRTAILAETLRLIEVAIKDVMSRPAVNYVPKPSWFYVLVTE